MGQPTLTAYGRPVPSASDMASLVVGLATSSSVWQVSTFADSMKEMGFRRVRRNKSDYYAFSLTAGVPGQAPFSGGLIEEVRLFVGTQPKNSSEAFDANAESDAREIVAHYLDKFSSLFGPARTKYSNYVWTPGGSTVRLLPPTFPHWPPVWVVVSWTGNQVAIGRTPW